MEKELEGQAKSLEKRFKPLERTDEPDLKDEDIKEILHDVLTEGLKVIIFLLKLLSTKGLNRTIIRLKDAPLYHT
ncbi:MAG: hypothetical protein WBE68_02850 [Candidatus Nitrosopolaris sp.]